MKPARYGALVAWLGHAHMFQVMAAVAITMALVFAIATRHPADTTQRSGHTGGSNHV